MCDYTAQEIKYTERNMPPASSIRYAEAFKDTRRKMSNYEHTDWCCQPANKAEAQEIVERAIASGAKIKDVVGSRKIDPYPWDYYPLWGVYHGETNTGIKEWAELYTIAQLREIFPLPNEQKEEKPIYTHEYKYSQGVYVECKVIASKADTFGKILIENEYGQYVLTPPSNLRPLKSKCDKWVEDAAVFAHKHAVLTSEQAKHAAYAIYKAITSGELKAPEIE